MFITCDKGSSCVSGTVVMEDADSARRVFVTCDKGSSVSGMVVMEDAGSVTAYVCHL